MKNYKIKINKIFFISILAASIFACSKPLDIDIDDSDKRIVLNGMINPDSLIRISLTKSLGVLENDRNLTFISGAEVKLYENDEFIENMQLDTFGNYYSTKYPEENKTYKITCSYGDLEQITARAEIPKHVEIKNFEADYNLETETEQWYDPETGQLIDTTFYRLSDLNIELTFDDPADEINYYFVTFTTVVPVYEYFPPNYDEVFIGNKMQCLDYNMGNVSWNNNFWSTNFTGYVISDELFNGSQHTINASVYTWERLSKPIYINLHSISESFYNFATTYSKYEDALYSPLTEPVNVLSNIENGYGFFSGYSSSADSLVFIEE